MRLYRRLLLVATVLAFAVIALGAYVRLSDAGLGCPDWPGCYGHLIGVPDAVPEQHAASQAFPQRPVDTGKAWKEMIHRYCAGTLGVLILALCLLSWRRELRQYQSPALPTALLGIVGLQAALGMWTVTLLLKPVIVTLHLLGGMSTLALLVALSLRESLIDPSHRRRPVSSALGFLDSGLRRNDWGEIYLSFLRSTAFLALLVVIAQIALGGWVSSNYAALACTGIPLCQGAWVPSMDFAQAFSLHRELGQTAEGGLLSFAALTAIHWSHRAGALIVVLVVGSLARGLLKTGEPRWRHWGILLLCVLGVQVGLGIANILLSLPLALAVGHNLGAACLLSVTLAINLRLRQGAAAQVLCRTAHPVLG